MSRYDRLYANICDESVIDRAAAARAITDELDRLQRRNDFFATRGAAATMVAVLPVIERFLQATS
jgi:hypothetical protein